MVDLTSGAERKRLGAWSTPPDLVDRIVDAVLPLSAGAPPVAAGRPLRVLDPACGDGRFLRAVGRRAASLGLPVALTGLDIDPDAVDRARRAVPDARIVHADALALPAEGAGAGPLADPRHRFDLVIGNPPFLSQLAEATTRGGVSPHGGGPYADAAVEFLALAARLVSPAGGRVAFVLPQSVLASRDAAPVRRAYAARSTMVWSWWSPTPVFDAQVVTCALAFEFGRPEPAGGGGTTDASWAHVVTGPQGVPPLPVGVPTGGTLGDRARVAADFRDHYYGLVPAVVDGGAGPPLITSGLIDPGRCDWGQRPVRFAKRRWSAPTVELSRLDERMRRWARERQVTKVLVANQTAVVEAVCDPGGSWLPGVPVLTVHPDDGRVRDAWEIAAVLTSPVATAWAWHRAAGTGMSAAAVRLSPAVLADLPWPTGSEAALRRAVAALRRGDVRACGRHVDAAYGATPEEEAQLATWWIERLERVERRAATVGHGHRSHGVAIR